MALTYKGDQDVFEAHFTHEAAGGAAFNFEILEHNLFRSDWDGQCAKLFKKRSGDYVLQMPHELWVAHKRKRAAADRLLGEKRPKQRRSYTDVP